RAGRLGVCGERVGGMASPPPPSSRPASPGQRRSLARTAVVWSALEQALQQRGPQGLRVLDIGGGTGGFAVRVAGLGADVVVVDPSPDALAALARRAREGDVAERVRGVQGDLDSLRSVVEEPVDVVLCHGVLDVVAHPDRAWEAFTDVL